MITLKKHTQKHILHDPHAQEVASTLVKHFGFKGYQAARNAHDVLNAHTLPINTRIYFGGVVAWWGPPDNAGVRAVHLVKA